MVCGDTDCSTSAAESLTDGCEEEAGEEVLEWLQELLYPLRQFVALGTDDHSGQETTQLHRHPQSTGQLSTNNPAK